MHVPWNLLQILKKILQISFEILFPSNFLHFLKISFKKEISFKVEALVIRVPGCPGIETRIGYTRHSHWGHSLPVIQIASGTLENIESSRRMIYSN